jgi:hypothetical protein
MEYNQRRRCDVKQGVTTAAFVVRQRRENNTNDIMHMGNKD